MSVERHLNIRVDEYDARIRTFVPGYEEMIANVALTVAGHPRCKVIVECGPGTGALTAECLAALPAARAVGIEIDGAIVELARRRLAAMADRASFVEGSFLEMPLPPCDALVACLALHHVHSREQKQALYDRIRRAVGPAGIFVTADCFPSRDPARARAEHAAWHQHLHKSYSEAETESYFESWSREDRYFPLEDEIEMMQRAGFAPEVIWRGAPMAVVAALAR